MTLKRVLDTGGPIKFGDWFWDDEGVPAGPTIITVDLDDTGTSILPFTEAATSGTATATSIYVVSIGGDGLTGIQNGGVDVRDLGELQTAPVYRTRVEWFTGLAIFNGRAVTRLWSIADAAVTA